MKMPTNFDELADMSLQEIESLDAYPVLAWLLWLIVQEIVKLRR